MPAKKAHTTIDLANFTGNFITFSLKFGFDKTFYLSFYVITIIKLLK